MKTMRCTLRRFKMSSKHSDYTAFNHADLTRIEVTTKTKCGTIAKMESILGAIGYKASWNKYHPETSTTHMDLWF